MINTRISTIMIMVMMMGMGVTNIATTAMMNTIHDR